MTFFTIRTLYIHPKLAWYQRVRGQVEHQHPGARALPLVPGTGVRGQGSGVRGQGSGVINRCPEGSTRLTICRIRRVCVGSRISKEAVRIHKINLIWYRKGTTLFSNRKIKKEGITKTLLHSPPEAFKSV